MTEPLVKTAMESDEASVIAEMFEEMSGCHPNEQLRYESVGVFLSPLV